MGYYNRFPMLFSGGIKKAIKSIQPFSITVTGAGVVSNTAAITAVDTDYAQIVYCGQISTSTASAGAAPNTDWLRVELTNSTTVTAYRNSASSSQTIYGYVVEWEPAVITSIQAGTITIAGTSGATAITAVDMSRSAVFFLGQTTTYGNSTGGNVLTRVNLTDVDEVTATRDLGSGSVTVGYVVVEFAAGVLKSATQEKTITLAAVGSNTAALSPSIDMSKAMLAYGGCSGSVSNANDQHPYIELTDVDELTATKNDAAVTATIVATAIEFNPAYIKSIQRDKALISGAATDDVAISAVDLSYAFASFLGRSGGGDTMPARSFSGLYLEDVDNVRALRSAGTGTNLDISFEVIEFNS